MCCDLSLDHLIRYEIEALVSKIYAMTTSYDKRRRVSPRRFLYLHLGRGAARYKRAGVRTLLYVAALAAIEDRETK